MNEIRKEFPTNAPQIIFEGPVPICSNPRTQRYVDRKTGEHRSVTYKYRNSRNEWQDIPCQTNTCPECVVHKVRSIARSLTVVEPEVSITLTQTGNTALEIQRNCARFVRRVRRIYPDFQYCWFAESVEPSIGSHAHMYAYVPGRKIKLEVIKRSWEYRTHVKRIMAHKINFYVYPMKMLLSEVSREEYLSLNSSGASKRIFHASNQFWRDPQTGKVLSQKNHYKVTRGRFKVIRGSAGGETNIR